MEDKNEEFTNEKSLRNTILEEKKDNEEIVETSPKPKSLSKKNLLIILVLILTVVLLFSGIALYVFLRGEPEKEIDQEFSVTIEVFKYRKEHGEKEHEKPNLNEPVYFLGEDFKCNETDFDIYLDGKSVNFSKNFTFNQEGNYTMTFKFTKQFESLENLFRNCYYITKVNFTKIAGNKLTDISKLFYSCDGLYEINLEGLDTSNVKKANQMF